MRLHHKAKDNIVLSFNLNNNVLFPLHVLTRGILDLSILQNKPIKKYCKHWDADADSGAVF